MKKVFIVNFLVSVSGALLTNSFAISIPKDSAKRLASIENNPAQAPHLKRMQAATPDRFCTHELRQFRNSKLSDNIKIPLIFMAETRGITTAELDLIRQETLDIGMSECAVLAAVGKPKRVNVTQTASHSLEQWAYGPGQYVYLQDGRVTNYQTRK